MGNGNNGKTHIVQVLASVLSTDISIVINKSLLRRRRRRGHGLLCIIFEAKLSLVVFLTRSVLLLGRGALRDGVSRQDAAARLPKAPTTATSSSGKTAALPPPATNSFQFEADLRAIGSQPQQIYKYLRVKIYIFVAKLLRCIFKSL